MATFVKPDLPGTIVRFAGDETLSVAPSFNETVAIIGSHDWGPLGLGREDEDVVGYTSLQQFETDYGTTDTQLRRAVVGAFIGQGEAAGGGAGAVIVYRAATAAADTAELTRQNTTPANAITFTALNPGTRGNEISIVIEDDPNDGTKDRLRILFEGVTVERFSYAPTNIAALAASVNATSKYVTATSLITGVALTPTTGTSLAGGNDGEVLTATEYEDAQATLEYHGFTAVGAAALTDTAIQVQLATWVKNMEEGMRPVRLVIGGPAGETVAEAIAELEADPELRDPQIVRIGGGDWYDSYLEVQLSTAELVGRMLGGLAARGLSSSLTRMLLAGITPVGLPPTQEDLIAGAAGGVTVLRRVSNPLAKVAVSWGKTTFIDDDAEGRPLELFSEPRIVGLLNATIRRIVEWGDDVVIGDLPVTDDTRNLVRQKVTQILEEYEETGLATPGTSFVSVEDPEDPALADAIPFEFGFRPTRTANFLIGNGRVR
jgi:hypothetical protein